MGFLQDAKYYFYMILVQAGCAGMTVLSTMALDQGMSPSVLVVYRHAFATAMLLPFAYFFERKSRPQLTFRIFCHIFFLGLVGIVANLNFYYLGLKLTSPTFATALSNVFPAMTFLLALLCRMEKVKLREIRSHAKVVGTLVCVGGAMLMTMYKGPAITHAHHAHVQAHLSAAAAAHSHGGSGWLKGCVLIVLSTIAWAALFVQQSATLKLFPAELTLTTWMCFVGTLESAAFALAVERDMSKWTMGCDIKLLTCVYSALAGSVVQYYLQGVCMKAKGPVFASAFIPLTMIMVAALGTVFVRETIYLGSMVGAVFITTGLYAVLWGKRKDGNLSSQADELQLKGGGNGAVDGDLCYDVEKGEGTNAKPKTAVAAEEESKTPTTPTTTSATIP